METKKHPRVLIGGTGRSGTTFLIKLFSFLDFDTGFNRNNYSSYIYRNCNSGMENNLNCDWTFLKEPSFISDVGSIIKSGVPVRCMIIPIRNYEESAESRVRHGKSGGGLWHAQDKESQIAFYHKIMAEYLLQMVNYDINTIFLDFKKMTTDKEYLYQKLKVFWDEKEISFEYFSQVYDEVSETSRPKPRSRRSSISSSKSSSKPPSRDSSSKSSSKPPSRDSSSKPRSRRSSISSSKSSSRPPSRDSSSKSSSRPPSRDSSSKSSSKITE